jgi:cation diffusion facilitator family transporter
MALNLAIPLSQVVGGIMAQSMALVSDAAHNFSDFTGLLAAYVAYRIGRRPPSLSFSFGFRRAEILAALLNVGLVLGASAFILLEAMQRLRDPQPVAGALVVVLAGVGIVGNGLSAWLLHRGAEGNLNMRGAFLHMMADLLTSVVVLANGIVLLYRPWYWLDPLLSLGIVAFIVRSSWSVLGESVRILMEGTPGWMDMEEIRQRLASMQDVTDAHHLHAWTVTSGMISFTCHVQVPDRMLSKTQPLAERIRRMLAEEYGIEHVVLEFEPDTCGEGQTLCMLPDKAP